MPFENIQIVKITMKESAHAISNNLEFALEKVPLTQLSESTKNSVDNYLMENDLKLSNLNDLTSPTLSNPMPLKPNTPLDVWVKTPDTLVIYILEYENWCFQIDKDASGEDIPPIRYSEGRDKLPVKHFGEPFFIPGNPKCVTACIPVKSITEGDSYDFNFYMIVGQSDPEDKREVPIIIDPKVRND